MHSLKDPYNEEKPAKDEKPSLEKSEKEKHDGKGRK
jgi:hypothetical protein